VAKPKKAALVRRAKPRLADNQQPNQKYKKLSGTPAVPIVFLVGDKLLIDRTPVSKGETYSEILLVVCCGGMLVLMS
jgi:hypothetical protein